jgi:Protein of unknown function (DUF3987)
MADNRLLPNWLEAYLAYTAESRSPEEYHLWTGVSCIAAVLRRNVFFDMQYFVLYPNMYVVLVGPAGRCKKSTAMRIGKGMFRDIPGVGFSADSTTRERLIQDLAQSHKDNQSALTTHSTEFASLLTSSQMDMVVFLTDIYDCPPEWEHRTKTGGIQKIKSPFLNLLGATTPEWIARAMPLDTIGIGLTSRIIFVYQDTPRIKPPFPELSEEQKILYQMLKHDLALMSTLSHEYKFDNEAKQFYEEWDTQKLNSPNPTNDPRLNGYYERKPMHLIKLAMIVVAATRDDNIIHLADLKAALELFDRIEPSMTKVFSNVGKNPLAVDIEDTFVAIVAQPEGATLGELLDRMKYSVRKEELIEVLDTLATIGKILRKPDGRYVVARQVSKSGPVG